MDCISEKVGLNTKWLYIFKYQEHIGINQPRAEATKVCGQAYVGL